MGKAILISSHILAELGEMCDSVVVIEEGRIRASGSMREITRGLREERARVYVRCLCSPEELERALLEEPLVLHPHQERDGMVFGLEGGEDGLAQLVASLVRRGLKPVEVVPEEVDLEDVFLSLTEGNVQ